LAGPRPRVWGAALSVLMLGAAGGLVLLQAMREPLSHDEHQFVASGWLLGAQGLLPYRDFPFHHLPNLALVYAVLGRISPAVLLNARLLSSAFGLGTAVLIFAYARRELHDLGFWPGWSVAVAAVASLVLSPLFQYTNGRAWNHALPTLLTVAAFCVHLAARRSDRPAGWLASGVLLGIAAGTRASSLTVILPFALFALGVDRPPSDRPAGRSLGYFLAGTLVGLAPAAVFAGLAPRHFVYGNLIYPLQNAQYRQLLLHEDAMNLLAKLAYFVDQVLLDPPHLLLAAAGLWLIWKVLLRPGRTGGRGSPEIWLSLGTAAALWVGALIPTPSWYQYFYAPLPFGLLALVSLLRRAAPRPQPMLAAAALFAVTLVALRAEMIGQLGLLARPADWLPNRVHRLGVAVAEQVGAGPVLALAPIVPLEGGLKIYPEFATGSLSWRVSPFMAPGPRQVYGVVSPEDLPAYLDAEPPAAVLVGFEIDNAGFSLDDPGGLEIPLEEYAREHGYQRTSLECPVCARKVLSVWERIPEADPPG